MSLMNSLENIENQLKHCMIEKTVFNYWNHQIEMFDFLKMEDNDAYKGELVNLSGQLRSGVIKSVLTGEPLMINGKVLQKSTQSREL